MSRPPDFKLKAMNKATNEKSPKVGAAWKNTDGSISIDLDAFVILTASPDLVLTLFPNEPYVPKKPRAETTAPAEGRKRKTQRSELRFPTDKDNKK